MAGQVGSFGLAVAMSVKRFPQLAHWGAYTAVVEDGKLIRCEPFARDQAPSPLLDSVVPYVYGKERITEPMVRRGWLERPGRSDGAQRGRDAFVEVSWDSALKLVADETRRVREHHGAHGIFGGSYGWSSAGRLHHARTLARRFQFLGGGCVDQVGNYSWGTAQFILPYVIGTDRPLTGRVTSWPSILEHCEIFIAFGGLAVKNGQVTSGGAGEHSLPQWLRRLAATGAKVINISPLRSDCPDELGAEWIPIRPNTDVALMLAIAYEIVEAERHDSAFLATHCVGWQTLSDYILGYTDGVAKTPQWASDITGVPAQRIAHLAVELTGRRSYLTASLSVQRAHHGEQPFWMLMALAAILGQIGLPGGGFGFGHGSLNGVSHPRRDTPGPEWPTPKNPSALQIPVARIADMLLKPGQTYEFLGKKHEYPDIRLVHWAGGNPFHHHQQLDRLQQAWARPETVIVQDIAWTATARRADIVLPVTTSLERNDIGGSSRDNFVFAMHQAIAPMHMARSDLDIFTELAQRLGYGDAYTEGRSESEWISAIYERFRQAQGDEAAKLPDFDTFWQAGHVELSPPGRHFILFEDYRRDPGAHPLRTASGRIELVSETLRGLDTDCGFHPAWREPVEWLGAATAVEYPLHLVSHQPADRLHSQLNKTPAVTKGRIAGCERIMLNPQDAADRGLQPGDRVRVFNGRGQILAGLALDEGIMKGVCVIATGADYMPDHTGIDVGGAANTLTLDIGTSSLTQGPNAMSCLVQVMLSAGEAGS